MKKLLTAGAFIFAIAIIHATANDNSKAMSDRMYAAAYMYADTIPSDTMPSDTTKKDTMQFGSFAYNVSDTVPTDTTKKDTMFTSAVAYRLVTDTVPTDTTKKDTTFQSMAFNR